jgi:hypothetical protein
MRSVKQVICFGWIITLANAGPPRESLLKRLVARSAWASVAAYVVGGWVNRLAMVALALLAWKATGGSFSTSSSIERMTETDLVRRNTSRMNR